MSSEFFAAFLYKEYLPEVRKAYKNIDVPFSDKMEIVSMGLGFGVKILYAFLYQEQALLPKSIHAIFDQSYMIWIGGFFAPEVNELADWLTGFKQTDDDVNNSVHLYPGQHHCKYH